MRYKIREAGDSDAEVFLLSTFKYCRTLSRHCFTIFWQTCHSEKQKSFGQKLLLFLGETMKTKKKKLTCHQGEQEVDQRVTRVSE